MLHDDDEREYGYGPAARLPDTKVGTFTLGLYDEAKKKDIGLEGNLPVREEVSPAASL